MPEYRKKPVVIEAIQFDGANAAEIIDWVNSYLSEDADPAMWEDDGPCLMIMTLEGEMRADLGDWVIRGVKGEFYPCKPDIFDATYDQADLPADRARRDPSGVQRDGPGPVTGDPTLAPATFLRNTAEFAVMRWDGTRPSIDAVCRWVNDVCPRPPMPPGEEDDGEPIISYTSVGDDVCEVIIGTATGLDGVEPGDWIVCDPTQGPFPVKPGLFDSTYRRAELEVSIAADTSIAQAGAGEVAEASVLALVRVQRDVLLAAVEDSRWLSATLTRWPDHKPARALTEAAVRVRRQINEGAG